MNCWTAIILQTPDYEFTAKEQEHDQKKGHAPVLFILFPVKKMIERSS